MRIEHSIITVSWIPSDLMEGMGEMATRMKLAHYDQPPPDELGADTRRSGSLRVADRFRFANRPARRTSMSTTTAGSSTRLPGRGRDRLDDGRSRRGLDHLPAVSCPTCQAEPGGGDGGCASPRPSAAAPGRRAAPGQAPPFVQYHAPIAWTTLELTIYADGRTRAGWWARRDSRVTGSSTTAAPVAKSSLADYKHWMNDAFGRRTPWGDEDQPALVTAGRDAARTRAAGHIMRGQVKRGFAVSSTVTRWSSRVSPRPTSCSCC